MEQEKSKQMENNKQMFLECDLHDRQERKWFKITENNEQRRVFARCLGCFDKENKYEKSQYVMYEKVKQKVQRKIKNVDIIIQIMKNIKGNLSKLDQKVLENIQNDLISKVNYYYVEQMLIESINYPISSISREVFEIFSLKMSILLSSQEYWQLEETLQNMIRAFPEVLEWKSTDKIFRIYENLSKLKVQLQHFPLSDGDSYFNMKQQIKSNLIQLKSRIFICGDQIGNVYAFDIISKIKTSHHLHGQQVSNVEKISDELFVSGSLDGGIAICRLNSKAPLFSNDLFEVISRIKLHQQVFRIKMIDEKRIAVNQLTSVCILNINTQHILRIEANLYTSENSNVFGIIQIKNNLIVLHQRGLLNFWDCKNHSLIRSHQITKNHPNNNEPLYNEIYFNNNNQNQNIIHNRLESFDQEIHFTLEDESEQINFKQDNASGQINFQQYNEYDMLQDNNGEEYALLDHNFNIQEFPSQNINEIPNQQQGIEEEEFLIGEDQFNLNFIPETYYARIRQIGTHQFAVVTFTNDILIYNFDDFYFKQPPLVIQPQFDVLCLESIPNTSLLLIAGQQLQIYDLEKYQMVFILKQESNSNQYDNLFGENGFIGGSIYNQNIVTINVAEAELILLSFKNVYNDQ